MDFSKIFEIKCPLFLTNEIGSTFKLKMGKHSAPKVKKRKMRDFVTHKKKLGKKVQPSHLTDLSFKSQCT
jgi:hypothetical protein